MAEMKAVRFDHYGDIDVLEVCEVPRPSPGPGEVLVEVKATGINPGEAMIRKGALHNLWPATFPSGQGSDLAGVVAEVGPGVETFTVGEEVLGFDPPGPPGSFQRKNTALLYPCRSAAMSAPWPETDPARL